MKTPQIKRIDPAVNSDSPIVRVEPLVISPPKIRNVTCEIQGKTPYVSNKMGASAIAEMREALLNPGTKAKKKHSAKDFDQLYQESMHVTKDGWAGIPTNAFLQAMIRACKLVGFEMTDAKCALFVEPHGVSVEGLPLLKIQGDPKPLESRVVLGKGAPSISVRAVWETWSIVGLKVEFDRDVFNMHDVYNLLRRAGQQVGVGAGRPFSVKTAGMGWGTFVVTHTTSNDK